MKNSVINNILGKHFSQESISPAENEILRQWISDNENEYEHLANHIHSLERDGTLSVDTNRAWNNVSRKITPVVRKKTIRTYIERIAVAAAVTAVCFFVGNHVRTNYYNKTTLIVTDATSTKTITMPDKSVITLNKNSSLQYKARQFAEHRNVVLKGEAFFEVTPDKKHSFEVHASSVNVRVLGTSFNIKSRITDDVCVNVKTGRVEVAVREQKVVLSQGEEARLQNKQLQKQETADLNYLSWKERRLIFTNTPLSKVISTLEEYYGIKILTKENILKHRVTTVFTSETTEQALNELKLLLHFEYKKENDVYMIYNFQSL